MNKNKPFCTVPFAEGFSGIDSAYRNCCAADPQISSLPGQSFSDWLQDSRLVEFKQRMYTDSWPAECQGCRHEEETIGSSFRTAVNGQVTIDENFDIWPSRWNLKFGNICNLACWTCNEHSSSVIAQHKKTINILPVNFVDPEEEFKLQWPALEQDVLKSYDYHDVVTLTLLGGEPLYNKTVAKFLSNLIALGLATRTRLEFHTNGTKINQDLFDKGLWNYVCVFVSLDAAGRKAEWLRYGSRWTDIKSNIAFYKSVANYVEVHCILSVLNINDLPALDQYCKSVELPLKITLLNNPKFMSIINWVDNTSIINNRDNQFEYYYNLVGNNPDNTSLIQLRDYINQFQSIRHNLRDYDAHLAQVLGLD
jgi:organic radical activating enzyme